LYPPVPWVRPPHYCKYATAELREEQSTSDSSAVSQASKRAWVTQASTDPCYLLYSYPTYSVPPCVHYLLLLYILRAKKNTKLQDALLVVFNVYKGPGPHPFCPALSTQSIKHIQQLAILYNQSTIYILVLTYFSPLLPYPTELSVCSRISTALALTQRPTPERSA
jgi:hypothetical protein